MSLDETIYLDHAATTPMQPGVLDAMRPYFAEAFANPAAGYRQARQARAGLDAARSGVAAVLGCAADEIVFTSGGTESDNLALVGAASAMRAAGRGRHIVTTAIEHEAVLHAARYLAEDLGFELTVVGVDACGRVNAEAIASAVRPDTVLVSVMLANNEIGTVQPLAEIAARLAGRALLHTDAVQCPLWLDLDVARLGVDLLSLSAHKFGGPRGSGVLYVRRGTPIRPVLHGGGQEGGLRSGTANVAGAVGLATALRIAARGRTSLVARASAQRDRLVAALGVTGAVRLTGHPVARLAGHASFLVGGASADLLLLGLDRHGIAVSSGSACASGRHAPSHVLAAIGLGADESAGALRVTLGPETTPAEIERLIAVVVPLIEAIRSGAGTSAGL